MKVGPHLQAFLRVFWPDSWAGSSVPLDDMVQLSRVADSGSLDMKKKIGSQITLRPSVDSAS